MKSLKFEGNQKSNVIAPLLITAFLVLVCPWGSAFGQAITGTLMGTVHDSSGAVVASVKIAVTNTATGISKQAVTNSYGDYVVPYLPPGQYQRHRLSGRIPDRHIQGQSHSGSRDHAD